ncbi:MAG TPA: GGDEF domain-containing protein [Anaerolineaceae bacterium]|nr:GGDEF domain-containing protein [Anaerolineaceae bacterium]
MQIKDSWILSTLLENTGDSIYIKDRECRLWLVSRKMALSLNVNDPAELYGKTDIELFGKEFGGKTMQDDLDVMNKGEPLIGVVERFIREDGGINWTSTTKFPLRNDQGEIIGLMGITREINELKDTETQLKWLATHDPLTSLANRYLLSDRIEQAIHRAKRNKGLFAILYIDLDGFKAINDSEGHDMGDKYLTRLAQILIDNVRSTDTVARIGGDEFVVLLDELHHPEIAARVAKKLSQRIFEETDPIKNSVSASIGISLFPHDGLDFDSLLKAADLAMFQAKKEDINFKFA